MAAKSKDGYNEFIWIKNKVIPSIKTLDHIDSTNNLILNFEKMYNHQTLLILILNDKLNEKKKNYGLI